MAPTDVISTTIPAEQQTRTSPRGQRAACTQCPTTPRAHNEQLGERPRKRPKRRSRTQSRSGDGGQPAVKIIHLIQQEGVWIVIGASFAHRGVKSWATRHTGPTAPSIPAAGLQLGERDDEGDDLEGRPESAGTRNRRGHLRRGANVFRLPMDIDNMEFVGRQCSSQASAYPGALGLATVAFSGLEWEGCPRHTAT